MDCSWNSPRKVKGATVLQPQLGQVAEQEVCHNWDRNGSLAQHVYYTVDIPD